MACLQNFLLVFSLIFKSSYSNHAEFLLFAMPTICPISLLSEDRRFKIYDVDKIKFFVHKTIFSFFSYISVIAYHNKIIRKKNSKFGLISVLSIISKSFKFEYNCRTFNPIISHNYLILQRNQSDISTYTLYILISLVISWSDLGLGLGLLALKYIITTWHANI